MGDARDNNIYIYIETISARRKYQEYTRRDVSNGIYSKRSRFIDRNQNYEVIKMTTNNPTARDIEFGSMLAMNDTDRFDAADVCFLFRLMGLAEIIDFPDDQYDRYEDAIYQWIDENTGYGYQDYADVFISIVQLSLEGYAVRAEEPPLFAQLFLKAVFLEVQRIVEENRMWDV